MIGAFLGSFQSKNAWYSKCEGCICAFFFVCDLYLNFMLTHLQRADFWNEACKLADLHHPNVVAFYGLVLDGPGGSVATVTEYMVNGSLRTALQRNDKYENFRLT